MDNEHCDFYKEDYEYIWYKLYVYYMTQTELYDRKLTDKRSPYDHTEAFIIGSDISSLSRIFAKRCYKFICSFEIPIYCKEKKLE